MSTILYFTSDRIAFTNVSATKNAETILLVPDPHLGNSLFIGNSTMVTYDAACNISTFNGSKALMTINTNTSQIGIGTSSPTTAFDVVDSRGINIVGPANITGTVSGTYFYGSALGLTNIPANRIVGTLTTANFSCAHSAIFSLSWISCSSSSALRMIVCKFDLAIPASSLYSS